MRESENTGKLIRNMVLCERGEHCLFRDYGLSATDDIAAFSRTMIQSEISRFYPGVVVKSLSVVEADEKGYFVYNVDVEGNDG